MLIASVVTGSTTYKVNELSIIEAILVSLFHPDTLIYVLSTLFWSQSCVVLSHDCLAFAWVHYHVVLTSLEVSAKYDDSYGRINRLHELSRAFATP